MTLYQKRLVSVQPRRIDMIPDFNGHHFLEDYVPNDPPSQHHCKRCGMRAVLRPDGSTFFDVGQRAYFSRRTIAFR